MNLETKKYTIENLMDEYLTFCQYSSVTQDVRSEIFGDFIGWLKQKEIRN